jgi:drug/metabolite transporter (DMT)-like permease
MSGPDSRRLTRRGVVWLVVSATSFGSLVVLIKGALATGLNAETALALRFTLAAVIWWAILAGRRRHPWPTVRQAAQAAALGGLVYAPNALAYYWGTARVSGSLAAINVAAAPVLVALLAWLLLRERLSRVGWLALVVAVAGGVMVAGSPEGRADPVGLLCLGLAVLLYSLYMVLSKPLTGVLAPPVATTYVIVGAAVVFWLWGGLAGRLDFHFTSAGWLAIAGLAVVPTVLAMSAFMAGVEILGATRAAIVNSLEPVVGVALSVLILGDRPDAVQIAGGGLVTLAAVLVQWERGKDTSEVGSRAAEVDSR